MRVCIHRGTKEVGGTCIQIESSGEHLILDVGLPLDAEDSPKHLPKIKEFMEPSDRLLAVVLSHPHQDHYGLAKYLPPGTKIIMGAAAERILKAAALFSPGGVKFQNVTHLEPFKTTSVGPFTITPYLNDHSAYDAFSLLIEADSRRLFYSGDFRGHGRKASVFERFLKAPPPHVDVLLMEGTTIGRVGADARFPTERELEGEFLRLMREAEGMVLVWTSGQNIDRLVTVFKACRRSGRQLILDLYTAEILRATGNPRLPQGFWKGVKVFLPASQKRCIKKTGNYDLVNQYRSTRIFPEHLSEEAAKSVMLFRPSMTRELESARCLKGGYLIYSLWPGYLKQDRLRSFHDWLKTQQIPLHHCHTSGHASVTDLKRFAQALTPKVLVPIHSFEPKRFEEFFGNVEMKNDGEWWGVR